jgi:small GTP-binding protein
MGVKKQIFKIMVAGDEGIGKSAFLERIASNRFLDSSHKTIGVEFFLKDLEFQNTPCVLQLWDFGKGTQFKDLLEIYLLGSKGAFLLFDLTKRTTLDNIVEWIRILRKKEENLPIIILGTKSDLNSDRRIEKDYVEFLVQKYNLVGFLEISSKSGYNIEIALTTLLAHIFEDVVPIPEEIENVLIKAIELAIEESRKCISEDDRLQPKVGAVLIKNDKIIESAYRGELNPGEHAEYTLLKQKLKGFDFSDSTLIITLEPCIYRSPPKVPCANIIINCGIKEVIIGVIDPNEEIRGLGIIWLQLHKISVQFFEDKYTRKVVELNETWWDKNMKKYKIYLMKPVKVSLDDRLDQLKNQQNVKKKNERKNKKRIKNKFRKLFQR